MIQYHRLRKQFYNLILNMIVYEKAKNIFYRFWHNNPFRKKINTILQINIFCSKCTVKGSTTRNEIWPQLSLYFRGNFNCQVNWLSCVAYVETLSLLLASLITGKHFVWRTENYHRIKYPSYMKHDFHNIIYDKILYMDVVN